MLEDLIVSDLEILSGTPVFKGTRVPLAVLFGNLAAGLPLDEILDSYPTLSREQAVQALASAEKCMAQDVLTNTMKP